MQDIKTGPKNIFLFVINIIIITIILWYIIYIILKNDVKRKCMYDIVIMGMVVCCVIRNVFIFIRMICS